MPFAYTGNYRAPARVHTTQQPTVVVNVDDPRAWLAFVCDLMHVGGGWKPRPEVDELIDAAIGHRAHDAHQELTVCPCDLLCVWDDGHSLIGRDPVGLKVELPAYPAEHDARNPWVIYLPGVARSGLTDAANLDAALAPLLDVALRSVWWPSAHGQVPWTPHSFLGSKHGVA